MKLFKNKKLIILMGSIVFIITCSIGYCVYNNNRKNIIRDEMTITFSKIDEIEYGIKDFDVKKEIVQDIENCELIDFSDIDTNKVGKMTLIFTLKKDDVIKEVEHTISIVDTKAPEISLETENKELTVGDEYNIMSNINSVKDIIDGDIQFNKDTIDLNRKATEEYNKLKKDDIKEDTKVANKLISEFLIEDIKDKEEKSLYLKNCYYIDGSVDTSKSGEYKINVIAIDKNGNKVTKQFVVNVKPKEEKITINSNSKSTSNTSNSGSSNNNSPSTKKGSIQDVINTASAQVGKRYVVGGRGPDSFDCAGLIIYSFNVNGYKIGSPSSAGYSIGSDLSQAQAGDIIITPNHFRLYLGENNSAQAMNPSQGIQAGLDSQIMGYKMWKSGDPNYSSDPLKIIDIRRVR